MTLRTLLLAFVITSTAISSALAQTIDFEKIDGPYGGTIKKLLVASSGEIFAMGSNSGLYRSTDQGATWEHSDQGLPTTVVYDVDELNNGMLFIATSTGIYMSTDRGASWEVTTVTAACTHLETMSHGTALFQTDVLYRSTDGFNTATDVHPPVQTPVSALGSPITGILYTAMDQDIYKSTDDGLTWTFKQKLSIIGPTRFECASGYAIVANPGIWAYATSDFGETWTILDYSNVPSAGLNLSTVNLLGDGSLFVTTQEGPSFTSTDRGATWTERASIYPVPDIQELPSGNYLAASLDGIYSSTNSGDDWTLSTKGIEEFEYTAFNGFDDKLYTMRGDNPGMASYDDGHTWELLPFSAFGCIRRDAAGKAYVGSRYSYWTLDPDSINWHPNWVAGANNIFDIFVNPVNGDIYLADLEGLFVSRDGGQSFKQTTHPVIPIVRYPTSINMTSDGTIFTASVGNGIHASSDNGATWTQVNPDGQRELVIDSQDNLYTIRSHDIVMKSTDGGSTWSTHNLGTNGLFLYELAVDKGGNVFLATATGLVWTSDGGTTWHDAGLKVPSRSINLDSDSRLLLGTRSYGLYRSMQPTTSTDRPLQLASGIHLGNSYPNPASSTSTISFSLDRAAHADLRLYNISGEEVMHVHSGHTSPGSQRVTLDASSLPPGMYRYTLRTANGVAGRWMTVVR